MLSKISWGQFALAVVVILLLYYLFIGFSLYRQKLKDFLQRKPTITHPPAVPVDIPGDLVLIERIINEVRYEILPKAGEHATKDKLLVIFKNYLSGFSGQNMPVAFRTAINQMLTKETAAACNVLIDPSEIATLW